MIESKRSKIKRFLKELFCFHKYVKPVSVTYCEKCGRNK